MRTSSRTYFEILGLGLEASVLENCPVLGSRTALFFEPLKFCWKTPETSRKILRRAFLFSSFGDRLKKNFEDFFLKNTLRRCPWSMALASSIPVLGLERVCPRKSYPWPRIFCVLGRGLKPCVLDSTSGIQCRRQRNQSEGDTIAKSGGH